MTVDEFIARWTASGGSEHGNQQHFLSELYDLLGIDRPATPFSTTKQVAQHLHRARRSDVQDLLETLAALGHVETTDDGAYAT